MQLVSYLEIEVVKIDDDDLDVEDTGDKGLNPSHTKS